MSIPLRVLLVEDSPDDATLVLRELRRGGFAVEYVQVQTPNDFTAQLARGPWDVVISDFGLPAFSGLEALRLLRATGTDLPFILVSGTIGDEVAVEAMRAGAQDYLLKDRLTRLTSAVQRELRDAAIRNERRIAERTRREDERRFRLLVESVRALPWEATLDGRVQYVGPQAEHLLGYPLEQWYEGGFWARTVHADDLPNVLAILEAAMARNERAECTYRMRHADGTWRWFLDVATGVTTEQGTRLMRGFLIDVTQAREAEEQRAQAENARRSLEQQLFHAQKIEAIGTLAGGIAHDFNNILTSVTGFSELLERTLEPEHRGRRYVGGILQAAKRAQDLVRQILTFSRRQEPQVRAIQVEDIAEEAVNLLRASIPATITVVFDPEPDLPPVAADPGQIHQVVMNLGTNAFHAMEATGGTITIVVSACDLAGAPGIELLVRDTGCGMPEAVRKRIFEPFFTTKPTGQGTGLGLAVVHGIIEGHRGTISVDSREGVGTTFRIRLPATGAPRLESTSPDAPIPSGQGQDVLLIDDEDQIRQMGGELLEALGYTATTCASGHAGLALLRSGSARFAVVITDLTMPGMTGVALAEEIAALDPTLPVILSSGDLRANEQANLPRSVRKLLAKPYTLRALAETLESCARQR